MADATSAEGFGVEANSPSGKNLPAIQAAYCHYEPASLHTTALGPVGSTGQWLNQPCL